MPRSRSIRLAAVTCISAATLVHAQSRTAPHPPAPVSLPATQPIQAPPPLPPTPAQQPAQHARITYADNLLTVSASNSSLNQILREISRQTGIKITGGVADERVFGDYGPASSSEVLASLLDGTASNIVIVQSSISAAPAELILTPRMGGPTPPNPNATRSDDTESEDRPAPPAPAQPAPQPAQQPEAAQPNPQQQPQAQPTAPTTTSTTGATPPQNNPDTAAPTPAPADSNQQQSPNGVKTPQQIYDELMRLRQQQQAKPQ